MSLHTTRVLKNTLYVLGCALAIAYLLCGNLSDVLQKWLMIGAIILVALGFLVSIAFYRCPHCHKLLPANERNLDVCPYCKLPLRDVK